MSILYSSYNIRIIEISPFDYIIHPWCSWPSSFSLSINLSSSKILCMLFLLIRCAKNCNIRCCMVFISCLEVLTLLKKNYDLRIYGNHFLSFKLIFFCKVVISNNKGFPRGYLSKKYVKLTVKVTIKHKALKIEQITSMGAETPESTIIVIITLLCPLRRQWLIWDSITSIWSSIIWTVDKTFFTPYQ